MDTVTTSLITLAIGGFLGGLIKSLLDYRSQVFTELWAKRFESYKELWVIMGQIPRWPKIEDVSYGKVYEMSTKMRDWYFNSGGLLMSYKTRTKYGSVQAEINEQVLAKKQDRDTIITPGEYESILNLSSILRTEMTNDLLSRRKQI